MQGSSIRLPYPPSRCSSYRWFCCELPLVAPPKSPILHSINSCPYFTQALGPVTSEHTQNSPEVLFLFTDEEAKLERVKHSPQGQRARLHRTLIPFCSLNASSGCVWVVFRVLKHEVCLENQSQLEAQERAGDSQQSAKGTS